MMNDRVIEKAAKLYLSKNAYGLWCIATRLAEFDREELWRVIKLLKSRRSSRINECTVIEAMDLIVRSNLQEGQSNGKK